MAEFPHFYTIKVPHLFRAFTYFLHDKNVGPSQNISRQINEKNNINYKQIRVQNAKMFIRWFLAIFWRKKSDALVGRV
jgi:hypothetical protein